MILRYCATWAVVAFVVSVGCATSISTTPPTQLQSISDAELAHALSPTLSESDKTLVLKAMRRMPLDLQTALAHASPQTVTILLYDATAHQTYSNRPELKNWMLVYSKTNQPNVLVDEKGKTFAIPAMQPKPMLSQSLLIQPDYTVAPNPGFGPYRRVYSNNNNNREVYSYVTLSCGASQVVGSDRGYVYQGGWSNSGSAIDAGVQASIYGYYLPYMQIDGQPYVGSLYVYSTGSGPSNLQLACGSYYFQFGVSAYGTTGVAFTNIESTTDWTTGCCINGTIEDVAFDPPYRDWWYNPCSGCIVKRMTTIADYPENLGDHSAFGPIIWQNAEIQIPSNLYQQFSSQLYGCENYPAWYLGAQPMDGCQSTPYLGPEIVVTYGDGNNETDSLYENGVLPSRQQPSPSPSPTSTPKPTPSPIPTKPPPKCPPSSCGGGNAPVAGQGS